MRKEAKTKYIWNKFLLTESTIWIRSAWKNDTIIFLVETIEIDLHQKIDQIIWIITTSWR